MKKRVLIAIAVVLALSWTFAGRSDGQEPKASVVTIVGGESHVIHEHRPESESTQVELLDVGDYYPEQATVAKSGETWLGLEGGNSLLQSFRIQVKTTDYGEGTSEMQHVTLDSVAQPLFLVRGGGLSAGPVITLLEGTWDQPLVEKSPVALRLADASYELKVVRSEDTAACEQEGLPLNARLILTSGESRQVLYSLVDCGGDASWYLLWAGDLDRDGKLDLFVSVSQGDHDSSRKLFLSSKAGKERLVKEVAELVSYGC